ncbi:glucosylceramidase [Ekhidna lutea]|uniref:Glucosylceramidase n=1 Tax=Ekhidna lutea TaxID=447679 RepID=A0A239LVW0_EKHLU|nr:glycoside hydrolase family 30 protein [Ekhidna lutea]SNT34601.1 glucosylceramidase [Ekhidna lutea]
MKNTFLKYLILLLGLFIGCMEEDKLNLQVFETSASGNKYTELIDWSGDQSDATIVINPEDTFQVITGIGGSFTESSAYLLNKLSPENKSKILEAYFGDAGARYSLTRTHINSCDFSLSNYAYVEEGDTALATFSIEEDRDDVIPMIKDAMDVSSDGFKIISSPWTAPPWMKDNNSWVGGKLLNEHYSTWARYFSKYIEAYNAEGIDIWGVTFENEPLGNGSNWESMHYAPEEMVDFVQNYLGPQLEKDGHETKIFGYDQNRGEELIDWAEKMYEDEASSRYFDGTAVHWYASTFKWYGEALQKVHQMSPEKYLIETEGCVDAEVPKWKDDDWYWSKEATDWGWDWAPEEQKGDHPKYVPVYRYARDMIGCLNNWVDGWVDWNMVLDRQGGPNWFKNWCVAPVIVDPDQDEVYFTPLYYVMKHFSRHIRPGAVKIGIEISNDELMATAVKNPDGTIAVVVLNMSDNDKGFTINLDGKASTVSIQKKALQSILINQ